MVRAPEVPSRLSVLLVAIVRFLTVPETPLPVLISEVF
jgi:hypothetical protein